METSLQSSLQPERRFSIVKDGRVTEYRARMLPQEPPHIVHVMVIAPAVDANTAGEEVYNRLQDAGLDDKGWAFAVTGAGTKENITQPSRFIGLDSGEEEGLDLLLEVLYD